MSYSGFHQPPNLSLIAQSKSSREIDTVSSHTSSRRIAMNTASRQIPSTSAPVALFSKSAEAIFSNERFRSIGILINLSLIISSKSFLSGLSI
mmetsp:Transcript_27914/g.32071  ORF Transcript_27914/g.32071 Transcript_27914/m.32071 type:complete len:93 (-) Transcript_27914:1302-1580(-)